jgi:hypothetical protein
MELRSHDRGRELLKWIAIITMTIDHVGAIIYPEQPFFRIIGRLAFPIFSYLLILGSETTRNVKNYFLRLLIFAFISQIPYQLAFGYQPFEKLNIFFTLSFSLIFLVNPVLFVIPFVASYFLDLDFGLFGFILVACMRILKNDTNRGIIALLGYGILSLFVWETQIFSLLAVPIIILYKEGYIWNEGDLDKNYVYPFWRKYFFYIYYPLHLILLYLIKTYY